MTRLACFYNNLDPRTKASLEKYAPQVGLNVEWVDTSATQQTYAEELEKRWTGEEDLILVEQDKELHAVCLPSLMSCGEHWCGFTSWIYPEPHTVLAIGSFGCTKFSREVQRILPVSEFAGEYQQGIDRRFGDILRSRFGIGGCLHGHVVHHHVYEPRPESVRKYVIELRAQGILPPSVPPFIADPGLLPGSYRLMPDVPAEA